MRTAFVTGAAYGIGAASAVALARDGCDVAVSDLKPDNLAATPLRKAVFDADPELRARVIEGIPLHRLGTPEEMAEAVRYLASPQASFITGQTLLVDGRLTSY